jgi:hypothetical protein
MADINPITPVASGIQPTPQMSLVDMMNLARGSQAFNQAEQVNPLLLQQQQQSTTTGKIALSVEQQKDLERRAVQTFIADKKNYTTPNGEYDPNKALAGLTAIAPLTGLAHFKDLAGSFGSQETYKTAATGTQSAQMDFANKQVLGIASALTSVINHPLTIAAEQNPKSVNPDALAGLLKNYGDDRASSLGIPKEKADPLIQPYLDQAKNNPAGLRQFLKDKLLTTLDQGSRLSAMQPSGVETNTGVNKQITSTNEFGATRVGQPIPGTAVDIKLMPNESIITDTQNNSFIQTKDNNGRIISVRPVNAAPAVIPTATQPATPASVNVPATTSSSQSPVVAPKPNAMVQKLAPPTEDQSNLPIHSQVVQPRFPVRQSGQPVFNLQQGEADAQKSGSSYLQNVVAQRGAIAPVRNNLEKIMSTTDQLLANTISKAGKGLQIEQYFNKLADDSDYKILSKQLANLQMALIGNNPQALSSDAGKQMTAAASGTEIYPPNVLQKIAVQLHGEMENRDKQGIAADKYARKFGESNMASFTQMWNNNSDSKVFELMSLPKLIKDKEARGKMANEIIGYPTGSEQRKVFEQKYMNIQKLMKDGTL